MNADRVREPPRTSAAGAVADIGAIYTYIARFRHSSAEDFLEAMDEIIATLRTHPQVGTPCDLRSARVAEVRRCVLPGFHNILLCCRAGGDVVDVVRVLQGARNYEIIWEHDR